MRTSDTAISVSGLGLRTRRGAVYRDITFTAEKHRVTALLGSTGTGKTALLLTLAGRMRATHGSGSVCGLNLGLDCARIRRCTGLGLVAGVNDLDDALTAGQHAGETLLFRGGRGETPRSVLSRVGLAEYERVPVRDLDIEQREYLGIALGLVGGPKLLVVDDIDHDLSVAQQERVMALLERIASAGVTVLAACINEHTARLASAVVRLEAARSVAADVATPDMTETEAEHAVA